MAPNLCAAGGRRQQRCQHPDQSRFARAVGPEQPISLAGSNGEGDRVVRDEVPETFGEAVHLDRKRPIHGICKPLTDGTQVQQEIKGSRNQGFPASTTNVWPATTPSPSGTRRTEKVFRSRLCKPQFLRVANSERGLTEVTRAKKEASGR